MHSSTKIQMRILDKSNDCDLMIELYDQLCKLDLVSRDTKDQASALQTFADFFVISFNLLILLAFGFQY